MIVPDGYSTPDPPARSPVSRTELPLPRPPQPWRVSTAKRVEKSLSGGAQLIVDSSSSESDHVVLWPPDPSSTEVTCSGLLKVPAARSIESCGIRLVAVVQSSGPAYADVEQEASASSKAVTSARTFFRASSTKSSILSDDPSVNFGELVHAFDMRIPTTINGRPTPPSFHQPGSGVRYYLEIFVKRKKLSFRRNTTDFVPLVYLPHHPLPTVMATGGSPVVERFSEKGSPLLPSKADLYATTRLSLPDQGLEFAVHLPYRSEAARGQPLTIRLKIGSVSSLTTSKIISSAFSVKLKDLGQVDASVQGPSTIAKASEITFWPADLLPTLPGTAAVDVRAFTININVPENVCPSFSMPQDRPRAAYAVEVTPKFVRGVHTIVAPIVIVNTSPDGYTLSKQYYRSDAKGGMKVEPTEDVIVS